MKANQRGNSRRNQPAILTRTEKMPKQGKSPDWTKDTIKSELDKRRWYQSEEVKNQAILYFLVDGTRMNFFPDLGDIVIGGKETPIKKDVERIFLGRVSKPVSVKPTSTSPSNLSKSNQVRIYVDGSCINNPGPGGCAAVLLYEDVRKELSQGYLFTTNNRMELMAGIMALQELKGRRSVTVYSDSKYVVDSISKGWAEKWRKNGWMRNKEEKALNTDLWEMLLHLSQQHDVKYIWVKGHSGNLENEYCDYLATQAAKQLDRLPDEGYK